MFVTVVVLKFDCSSVALQVRGNMNVFRSNVGVLFYLGHPGNQEILDRNITEVRSEDGSGSGSGSGSRSLVPGPRAGGRGGR